MNHEENLKSAREVEIQKMQIKIDRMKQLVPTAGFFKCYFALLKNYKTNVEAFNVLNDEYYELFGVYRYDSWNSFRMSMKYHNKK